MALRLLGGLRSCAISSVFLLLLPVVVGSQPKARRWDEMRMARVVPSRIATLPLNTQEGFGIGSIYKYFGWGKDWLWVEGVSDYNSLNSLNFLFEAVAYPYEWYAAALPNKVKLRVGPSCDCGLAGIAVYSKADDDGLAWLRLQFEHCLGCESHADSAAIIITLQPSIRVQDSNLFKWMCAVWPHGVCGPSNSTTRTDTTSTQTTTEATTLTTTLEPTTTLEITTTTTRNAACFMHSVDTDKKELGPGKCVGKASDEKPVRGELNCALACNMRYLDEQAFYDDVHDMNKHVDAINSKQSVCKGYAIKPDPGSGITQCIIYTGDTVTATTEGDGWTCYGEVAAKKNGFEEIIDYSSPGCTTLPPEMRTTSTVSTTTSTITTLTTTQTVTTTTHTFTTTTTTDVQSLFLSETFEVGNPTARVFGFPGDVHFQRDGMAATLLQLQSTGCFDNIDYYMLGGTLPVDELHWNSILAMLKDTQKDAPDAWSSERDQCAASATVDRIPVDATVFKNISSSRITWFGKFLCTVLSVAFASLVGIGLATWGKCTYYPTGIPQAHKMKDTMFISYVVIAVLAACLTFGLVYVLGLIVCWFADRLASKKLAMGGSGAFLLMGPMLARLCLPVAACAAGAALVIWLWPAPEVQPKRTTRKHNLLISYDPINETFKPMITS